MRKQLSLILGLILISSLCFGQATDGPERFEVGITAYEAGDKFSPFPEGAVLFVGSSSVLMWKDLDEQFPQVKIINRGFGGSQFSDLLYYIDRIVTCYKPSKIFIYEGDNDISAKKKVRDIMDDAKKVRQIIAQKLPGVPVFFIAAKPSVARWKLKKKYQQLNSQLSLFAAGSANTGFVNVWDPALDSNGEVLQDIFLEDNLHMNEKGYAIWKAAIDPFL